VAGLATDYDNLVLVRIGAAARISVAETPCFCTLKMARGLSEKVFAWTALPRPASSKQGQHTEQWKTLTALSLFTLQ